MDMRAAVYWMNARRTAGAVCPRRITVLTRPAHLCFTFFNVMRASGANSRLFPVMRIAVSIPAIRISSPNVRAGIGA
jgi:hypothetical protein